MIPIAPEESTGIGRAGDAPADPLRQVVHVALAIYLMPVVAIVCAIGGVSLVLEKAARFAARLSGDGHRDPRPGRLAIPRSSEPGWGPSTPRDRRRTRVGR